MVWVAPDAVRCSMCWVRCWDCIAWDSCSAAYFPRLLLTRISIEVRKTGKSSEYNIMPPRSCAAPAQHPGNTQMGSMHPFFCWWRLMFGSSSHDDGRNCWIGKPAHSPSHATRGCDYQYVLTRPRGCIRNMQTQILLSRPQCHFLRHAPYI